MKHVKPISDLKSQISDLKPEVTGAVTARSGEWAF